VTNPAIRRLIKERILHAEQVVPDAPYQIRASDMQSGVSWSFLEPDFVVELDYGLSCSA
jgi:hypothetical protein